MSDVLRPTIAEISLENLRHNFAEVRRVTAPAKVLCVLKANAYGHGLIPVATVLSELGADYFGVALPEEGVALREAGIKTPILVFGGLSVKQIEYYLEHDLTFTVPSDGQLLAIQKLASERSQKATVHLKVDTGMGRLGVNWQRVQKLIKVLPDCPNIRLEGIYSHLAQADHNPDYTETQLMRFKQAIAEVKGAGFDIPYQHLANSAGIINHKDSHFNMVRPGLLLYGVTPNPTDLDISLKPVLSWKSQVVYFKTLGPDDKVSYDGTWSPKKPLERVVTLPLGYADGFGQSKSRLAVIIRGIKYPVVGEICMDQCMVSLGQQGEAYNQDEVVLIGKQQGQEISVETIAEQEDCCPHEILTRISDRVPRVYL